MGIIYADPEKEWGKIYEVCQWQNAKYFYPTFKYTGFMKRNLVYLAVNRAIKAGK